MSVFQSIAISIGSDPNSPLQQAFVMILKAVLYLVLSGFKDYFCTHKNPNNDSDSQIVVHQFVSDLFSVLIQINHGSKIVFGTCNLTY